MLGAFKFLVGSCQYVFDISFADIYFRHDLLNMANLTLNINNNNNCSIARHLSQCEHAKYIINLHNLYSNLHDDFQKQHIPFSYKITNLIFNHVH